MNIVECGDCMWLCVTWQWNVASEERTSWHSADWDEND